MDKLAIVYWSGTGNTEMMSYHIMEGAVWAGAEVFVIKAANFSANMAEGFSRIAFGCPAMGAEQLETEEFEPMFMSLRTKIKEKKIVLFGSYGWGTGEWMQKWEASVKLAGVKLVQEGLIIKGQPSDVDFDVCRRLGTKIAKE